MLWSLALLTGCGGHCHEEKSEGDDDEFHLGRFRRLVFRGRCWRRLMSGVHPHFIGQMCVTLSSLQGPRINVDMAHHFLFSSGSDADKCMKQRHFYQLSRLVQLFNQDHISFWLINRLFGIRFNP